MTAPPVAPSSPLPWSIIGQGNKPRSFAAAARNANKPKLSNPPPIQTTNQPTDLTNSQLDNMTRDQLVTAYETRFKAHVTTRNASKLAMKIAYKHALEHEASLTTAPVPTNPSKPSRPHARPITMTEFMISCDPSTRALQGPHGDPATIIRSLQTSIRQAFNSAPPLITLLGGRWSSQLSSNFVLTFAGQPSNDEILRFRHVLCSSFRPGATILP